MIVCGWLYAAYVSNWIVNYESRYLNYVLLDSPIVSLRDITILCK